MSYLIAYFTREGENYCDGSIKVLSKGNTERAAEFVREAVGGELFRIKPLRDYPEDYRECCDVAKRELQENARPGVEAFEGTLHSYDAVFLGYPNWWGVMPMCVLAFLDRFDLSGVRICPFCTNEGSGMGGSVKLLRRLYPEAVVEDGLAVHGAEVERSRDAVMDWAEKMAR